MHILMDLQPLRGPASVRGIGIAARGLAEALLRYAPDIQLSFLRRDGKGWEFTAARPGETEVRTLWDDPTRWKRADPLEYMTRTGVAVLYLTGSFQPEIQFPPVPKGVRTAGHVHDVIPLVMPERYIGPWPKWLQDDYRRRVSFYSQCDLLICDSHASAQDVQRHLKPSGTIAISYLAIRPGIRPQEPGVARQRLAGSLGLHPPYILSVSGSDYRKNNPGIVMGFAAAGLPHHRLVIVGLAHPGDRGMVQIIGRKLGIGQRIHLLQDVPDEVLSALYQEADLLLFPSRYEGLGLPSLEAMTCGTPVVGGNNSAFPEVVGEGGILVDVEQTEEIGRAVRRIAEDPALRAELSRKAIKQAARFTWQAVADNLRAAFTDLAARK